ncbi:hypothetical protein [Allostreptomyces psammosilenae]|uniref:Uncharacterized protein n=1 Tax=Allostreptomyces psammosilenae TaxID=1892865 RepID=A0A853ADA9_9ACTN|nr:hypothetical protein [Allostreptomyces psammosilenae]NYI08428.1 hypothetical protein [Allostreptomyces psammosilenae]
MLWLLVRLSLSARPASLALMTLLGLTGAATTALALHTIAVATVPQGPEVRGRAVLAALLAVTAAVAAGVTAWIATTHSGDRTTALRAAGVGGLGLRLLCAGSGALPTGAGALVGAVWALLGSDPPAEAGAIPPAGAAATVLGLTLLCWAVACLAVGRSHSDWWATAGGTSTAAETAAAASARRARPLTTAPWGLPLLLGPGLVWLSPSPLPAGPDVRVGELPGVATTPLLGWALTVLGVLLGMPCLLRVCAALVTTAGGAVGLVAGRAMASSARRLGLPLGALVASLYTLWATIRLTPAETTERSTTAASAYVTIGLPPGVLPAVAIAAGVWLLLWFVVSVSAVWRERRDTSDYLRLAGVRTAGWRLGTALHQVLIIALAVAIGAMSAELATAGLQAAVGGRTGVPASFDVTAVVSVAAAAVTLLATLGAVLASLPIRVLLPRALRQAAARQSD